MHISISNSNEATTAKKTAIETIHQELRRRIVEGEMAPGEKLHVDNLRQEFGVSTSTMREAISRLMVDSLVSSERQRGFSVTAMSLKDFRDITEARIAIEITALRASLANRTEEWEGELIAAFHRLSRVEARVFESEDGCRDNAAEWDVRNEHFHDCLVRNCENTWLTRIRRTLHQQSYRYQRKVLANSTFRRDVRIEHKAIFDAAMDGDVEKCVSLIEAHIRDTYEEIAAHPELVLP